MQMIDWADFVVVESITFDDSKKKAEGPHPPPTVSAPSHPDHNEGDEDMEVEEEMEMEVEEEEESLVGTLKREHVPIYARPQSSKPFQICQICKQEIPIAEMEEHMRIELLNPRAREKLKEMKAKEKETPLAIGGEISSSLKRFAERRTDLFGEEELEIGKSIGEDKELQRLTKKKERLDWVAQKETRRTPNNGPY